MTTFESSIRQIPFPQQKVYEKLSDLNNLQKLKERYAMMKDTMPEEARKQAEKIQDLEFDQDSLSVNVPPVGSIKLRVVNREEPKCIKFETEQSPIPFNFWIQLLPVTSTTCKMKLTIKAELNIFIKQMVKKPLQEGIEKIADVLQMIQYN
ncbi:SRPBCC family protein [uncultured Prevotella sp.]|uniref:SRPBCC family protein n=1 Tax=uncultured Prevotella sp. TaxID=159272 RepID=UPI0027E2EA96|nr:SRPBCC family protein [uncultured Prevotella sp.]